MDYPALSIVVLSQKIKKQKPNPDVGQRLVVLLSWLDVNNHNTATGRRTMSRRDGQIQIQNTIERRYTRIEEMASLRDKRCWLCVGEQLERKRGRWEDGTVMRDCFGWG